MADKVKEAYEIVFNDILNSGCNLMIGKYDAKNGNPQFMYGVLTVMEWIAFKANEKNGYDFSDLFTKNMVESEKKVLTK